jgi:hypothetical protein
MADQTSFNRDGSRASNYLGIYFDGRLFDKALGLFVRDQQRFDLSTQRAIARAGFVKERTAALWREFKRRLKEPMNLLPSFIPHVASF